MDSVTFKLATTAGAWIWEKYGERAITDVSEAIKVKWREFKWKKASSDYRHSIKRLYGTVQIMGMANPMPLTQIFTDLYMLDKPTAFQRFDIEHLSTDPSSGLPNARVNGLDLVTKTYRRQITRKDGQPYTERHIDLEERNINLFVLGKPGAGKTTFLKYVAVQAAESQINKVPIFISLKDWADSGKELNDFILERFDICGFPSAKKFLEELFASGDALVLFDGLDEVREETGARDFQIGAINNFVEKNGAVQCIITCRIAANSYTFKPFSYVEVADFADEQIDVFITNWFAKRGGEKDTQAYELCIRQLNKDENRGLRELARTPLLLTLLCLAFNETLTFPERRVELYEEALHALLKTWDASRRIKRDETYKKLSLGHKQNLLSHIAVVTFRQNEYFIQQDRVVNLIKTYVANIPPESTVDDIDGEGILSAIEAHHGLLVTRTFRTYSFSHLTFQEYFTAKYLVDNAANGALSEMLVRHCTDAQWREVILLAASMVSDASHMIKVFRDAISKLVADYQRLRDFLCWADQKASTIEAERPVLRGFYLYVELCLRFPNRSGFILMPNSRVIELVRAVSENPKLFPQLYVDYTLSLCLNRARALDRTRSARRLIDLQGVAQMVREMGLSNLAYELAEINLPAVDDRDSEWKQFSTALAAIVRKYRDIGSEWPLTSADEQRLGVYLKTNRLFEECLDLAYMPADEKRNIRDTVYCD